MVTLNSLKLEVNGMQDLQIEVEELESTKNIRELTESNRERSIFPVLDELIQYLQLLCSARDYVEHGNLPQELEEFFAPNSQYLRILLMQIQAGHATHVYIKVYNQAFASVCELQIFDKENKRIGRLFQFILEFDGATTTVRIQLST